MNEGRLEELLINAIEHAVMVSEQYTHDLVKAIGITSDELDKIGYDKTNFPSMHAAAEEE